jgi:cysteine desulfuration protein SufE
MLPARLQRTLDAFALMGDRSERIQALIAISERFRPVPEEVAVRPYPEAAKVPACESEAYCFPRPGADGTLEFHFAVENPQGISAKAMAVVLAEGLSGAPLEQVVAVTRDLPSQLFGAELSMGKNLGLTGMVAMVQAAARRALAGDA